MVAPIPGADRAPMDLTPPAAPAPDAAAPAAALALPPAKALAYPCLPGGANFGTAREAAAPAASQLAESPKPAAGPRVKAATVPADDPGCPADAGRTLMRSTAVAPDTPEATEEPHNQRSDKARANRAASRKAAADRGRPSAAAPAAVPLHRAPQPALVPSLPERAH